MNHDYTHCLDQEKDCPKNCFRKQLNEDLEEAPPALGFWLSWAHLKGTESCIKEKANERRQKKIHS